MLRFAVPSAVLELFINQPGDYAFHILPKVTAQRDDPAIDARLDLAAEERLPRVFPSATILDSFDHPADGVSARVDTKVMQELKRRQSGSPRLRLATPPTVNRKTCPARPLTVFALQRQESRSPARGDYLLSLPRDNLRGRIDKITQHLPANGWVRIEQPIQYRHAAEYKGTPKSAARRTNHLALPAVQRTGAAGHVDGAGRTIDRKAQRYTIP